MGAVDGQDVVHTLVQERPVMGHQQKSPLPGQIAPQLPPPLQVQVVGGLVDQQKGILLQKHGRQQHLRPLPVGEDGEGLFQGLLRQVQQPQLPLDLPVLRLRRDLPHHLQPCPGQVRHLVGEVLERHGGGDGAAVGVLPLQQPQEGGLPPAVPPGESQLPAGVDLKAHMVKDQLRTALISKCQVRDVDHRHIAFLLCRTKNGCGRANLSRSRAYSIRPVSGAVRYLGEISGLPSL